MAITKGKAMEKLKGFLKDLIYFPTVSGYEKMSADSIIRLCTDYYGKPFDECRITATGSIILAKKCGKKDAKKLCFDAHLDTIGFAVSEICGDGYLRLAPLGGIDANILPSSEVLILGKQRIRGIVSSIPPHLSSSDKLPAVGELLIDTGFTDEHLREVVSVGNPVMLYPHFTKLLGDRISSVSLDDKICIAAAVEALRKTDDLENTDIYLYFSSGEERGGNGSHHIYEEIAPDALIVLDVNFAKEKGSVDGEYGVLSEGAMMSFSAVTSIKFTRFVLECAKGEKLQLVNEMTYTGTNADVSARVGLGIPTAVVSIPIKYMHSSVETADMNDVISCANILCNVAEEYDKSPVCIPVYFKGGAGDEL
ncbi:MAG: M20/M25/M40 family metallo-hydrolase [Ruminococcaceae bacterium]|nr:M20/M25/M40 family metallo-hydrolase [Oscillospiraceae bacterium]